MVSYRELYPEGIGHAKDLDIKVPVCLQLVGHQYIGELKDTNLEVVMVEGKSMPIDASCGKVLLRNKMRGTGYDSLICHKPLEQFQEISDNVAAGRHEGWTLPSGVIVVCNQTWQDSFSSSFSHPGIYVPHALNETPLPDVTQGCEC
ncbi:hypothetical protein EMCRGX_G026290 [Ephydatia muelleri]